MIEEKYGLQRRRDMAFLQALMDYTKTWRFVETSEGCRYVSDEVFPSQVAIASMMGVKSVGTVNKAAKACEAVGLLCVNRSRIPIYDKWTGTTMNPTNRYTVTLPVDDLSDAAGDCKPAIPIGKYHHGGQA
jgi:hypothetical protein